MPNTECPYCAKLRAVADLSPDELVVELPHSVVVLSPFQYYLGYCVVIARTHATELSQLDDATRRAYLDEMCRVARAIETCFRPHKLNYELLGNQVPHLHWHLIPRRADDPDVLMPAWLALDRAERDEKERQRLKTSERSSREIAEMLRQALR